MIKHAYLIIAHNEFQILSRLLLSIDDERNDVYVHFDRKVGNLPLIEMKKANLFIVQDRVDVRWGHVSQIVCEFILFRHAYKNGPYGYYHILSGVDMPLKSQNEIHAFFQKNSGKEFIGFTQGDISGEIDRKVRRIHLFPRFFKEGKKNSLMLAKLVRYVFLRFQIVFNIRINKDVDFKKGTSWVSVTNEFVDYILPKFQKVIAMYGYSFCADEIFLHTICWESEFRKNIYDSSNENNGCMRMIGWKGNKLIDWTNKDYDILINSDAMFARKFSSKDLMVVDRILKHVL